MSIVQQTVAGIPERFAVEKRLGAGAFGTVMVVFDRERQLRLALKRLSRADSASIYRFKQEFRALADLSHPNLVRLHELFSLDDGWCFTMDLVEGIRFDSWVRGMSRDPGSGSDLGSTLSAETGLKAPPPERPSQLSTQNELPAVAGAQDEGERTPAPLDEDRLRAALRGLASGLFALHGAGILHRDLKPSNVLVCPDGRVVILDFGLAATGVVDAHQSVDGAVTGTPAYMSPEQARGAPLTSASDWYSVGVMLYDALSGELPFGGTVADMLAARQVQEPRDVRALRANLPEDLGELCMALLRRDPAARPNPAEIARRIGVERPGAPAKASVLTGAFVGRRRELEALREGFAETRRGRTVVAHVHGSSGYGKTTLVRQFLSGLALHEDVVVLEGRCYERESVPFKALDQVVDALGLYLRRLPPVEAAGLLPRDSRALVRLFPALGRLEMMINLPGRAPVSDAQELRRRAFTSLREMFARITDSRGLVLFMDDVHWGDADSASLVRHLLAPPEVPPLFLIVGYRGDASEDNELLRVLRTPRASDAAWKPVDVRIGPLPEAEAVSLARELLGDITLAEAHAEKIARESGGSPLFVAELVRALTGGRNTSGEVSLQRVLGNRIAALPDEARLVLEFVSCSARTLSEPELRATTELPPATLSSALDRLRDEHLLVVSGTGTAFEPLHDKVRLTVREAMDGAGLKQRHERLAETFAAAGHVDPETLAYHYGAAGHRDKALAFTERAADRAAQALAFDHAVTLCRDGLALATTAEDGQRVRLKLAEALASAGRNADAAVEYLALAEASDPGAARGHRRAAAEAYIRSGHVAEAMQVFGRVLEEEGLAPPRTPGRALAALLWNRTRLRLRGLGFEPRREADVDSAALRRIDACWVLGGGLAGIDLVRSAHYHAWALMMALDTGEPYRVSRSLGISAVMKALESAAGVEQAQALATRAKEVAAGLGNPHSSGLALAAEGVIAWGQSNFLLCIEKMDEAIALLRERGGESFREVGSLEVWFALHSLYLRGELRKIAERGPACVREAEARGDRYTTSTARAYVMPFLWAIQDRPEEGRREADAAVAVWPPEVWYHQHWARLRAHGFLDLYDDRGEDLLDHLQPARRRMKKAMQLRLRTLRFELDFLEGRGALARAASAPPSERARWVKLVRERLATLAREKSGLADAYAAGLAAGLSAVVATPEETLEAFVKARAQFESLGMPLHMAAIDIRRGSLLGGDEGRKLASSGQDLLRGRGVVAPERFANMLLPRLSNS